MISVSQQAISENNVAVFQIEAGQYQGAIENLSNTVRSFKHRLGETKGTHEKSYSSSSVTIDGCMTETSPLTEMNAAETYLYQHPIRIPANKNHDYTSDVFGTTYQECSMISCMIVFNLALAHHLEGMEQQKRELDEATVLAAFQKARLLYEITLNLHRDVQKTASSRSRSSQDVVFVLAVFNNLGLVHRRLQNGEASGKCFQHVLSTLMCLTDAGHSDRLSSQLDGFFVNVTSLISKTVVARAA